MREKPTSKGRTLILTTGLLSMVGYLLVAISLGNGIFLPRMLLDSNGHVANQYALSEGIETDANSTVILEPEYISDGDVSSKKIIESNSNDSYVHGKPMASNFNQVIHIPENDRETHSVEYYLDVIDYPQIDDSVTLTTHSYTEYNPLEYNINPVSLDVARAALTADYDRLIESGVRVPAALRYIDERIIQGKYGYGPMRK